jgi:putative phosphoesterase
MYKAINKHKNEIEVICHLGDGYADAQKLSEDYSDLTVHSVPGNCDFINEDKDKVINICSHSIFMTHGHLYDIKYSEDRLITKAKSIDADIVMFGHTHQPLLHKIDNITLINPGSISYSRSFFTSPSYAILTLNDKYIDLKHYYVN